MTTINNANLYLQNAMAVMPKDKVAFRNRLAVYDANKDGRVTSDELKDVMGSRRQAVVDDLAKYNRFNQIKGNLEKIKNVALALGPGFSRFVGIFNLLSNLVTQQLNAVEGSLLNKAEEYAVGKVAQDQFAKFAGAKNGGNGVAIDLGADIDAIAAEDGDEKVSALDLDLFGSKKISDNVSDWYAMFDAADADKNNDVTATELTTVINNKQAELNQILSGNPNAEGVAKARALRGELAMLNDMKANRDDYAFAATADGHEPYLFSKEDIKMVAQADDKDPNNITARDRHAYRRGTTDGNKYQGALARFDDINGTAPSRAQLLSYIDQAPQVTQLLYEFAKDTPEFKSSVYNQIVSVDQDVRIARRMVNNFDAFDTNKDGRISSAEIAAKTDNNGQVSEAMVGDNPFAG